MEFFIKNEFAEPRTNRDNYFKKIKKERFEEKK